MYIYSAGGGRVAESYPYLARPVVTYSPRHGLVRSVGSEPLIEVFDTQGVLRRRIVLDLPTEEIPRDDKLAVIEGIRARQGLEIWDYRDEEIEQSIENLQFPRHKSFWTTLFVDADGYFWLMIWEPPREEVTEWRAYYRLLSPEGEYLGETRWPGPTGTVAGDRLLTWDLNPGTGELNMPVVYRMQPLPAGFTFP